MCLCVELRWFGGPWSLDKLRGTGGAQVWTGERQSQGIADSRPPQARLGGLSLFVSLGGTRKKN